MRILILLQFYQGKNLTGTSLFNAVQDYIEGMTAVRDDVFVYVMLPEVNPNTPKWIYSEDDLPNPQSAIIPARPFGDLAGESKTPRVYTTMCPSPAEAQFLYPDKMNWYYDVVLDARAVDVLQIKNLVNYEVTSKKLKTPVVYWCHDAVIDTKDDHFNEEYAQAELYNMLQADEMVFYTEMDKKLLVQKNGRRWASPSQLRRILNSKVSHVPMDFGPVYDLKEELGYKHGERTKTEDLRLGYFASFWRAKRSEEIMEIFDKVHARYGCEMTVTSMRQMLPEHFQKDWIEFFPDCGREDYLPKLFDSDLTVMGSSHETGGRGYWEQLIAGNILVVKRFDWNKEFVPDWYKLVGNTWDDVEKLVFWAIKHPEEAREESAKLAEHIKDLLDYRKSAQVMLDVFESAMPEESNYNMDGSIISLVKKAADLIAKKKDKFSILEVSEIGGKLATNKTPILDGRYVTAKKLADMLEFCGYKDTHDSVIPHFTKK